MIIPDKYYKILKYLALFVLPALATFFNTLGAIWSIPYSAEISKTITAVGVLIAAIIGVSSYNYDKREAAYIDKQNELLDNFEEALDKERKES